MAKDADKTCPIQLDFMTTLVGCEYVPDNALKYIYTMDVDTLMINSDSIFENTKETVVNSMILFFQQKENSFIKLLSPTMIHHYKSVTGKVLYEISVTPEMYNKKSTAEKLLSDDEIYSRVKNATSVLRLALPVELDGNLYLIDADASYPRTFVYTYIMSNVEYSSDLDTVSFINNVRPAIIEAIKNDKTLKLFKYNNVIFRYGYFDVDREYVCSMNILPQDYK